jgi:DNA mismatch repair protein MutS
LFYLKNLRKGSLSLVHGISCIESNQYLILDSPTVKNLELIKNLRDGRLQGSLLHIIDFTVTSMGGRLLRSWLLHPLSDCSKIKQRLEAVDEFFQHTIERQELRAVFEDIFDLERLTGKISLAVANAKDLIALKKSLLPLPQIQTLIKPFASGLMKDIRKDWDNAQDIVGWIEETLLEEPAFLLTEGGLIKKGYNRELDEFREISHSGKTFITKLERKERERTRIPSLKIRYNKVFGYYIDVTKPNLHLVPSDYIRKQTLVNSERFITPELKEYEEKVLNAEQRIGELEYNCFLEIREKISRETERLQKVASYLATLDVLTSLAELASQRNYHCPMVNLGDKIRIVEGRHPVIEVTNEEPFIPNDTYMNRDTDQILIVTGPNMGGKSTYLRQVALICILSQMGSFVPAQEAEIGLINRIFTRIGAMDFLSVGQSTFMVEMLETANILNNATGKSLILLDEIGRGTSTFDGLSIAWKEDIIFLRKIVSGPSDQSYGIHVARLAGIPRIVIDRAKEILFNLEKKELDDAGLPRIAYSTDKKHDKSQLLLFQEDREREKLEEMREEIQNLAIDSLSPLEALNIISRLKKKMEDIKEES